MTTKEIIGGGKSNKHVLVIGVITFFLCANVEIIIFMQISGSASKHVISYRSHLNNVTNNHKKDAVMMSSSVKVC